MLKIEHLTKIYGEKKAVDDLNLHIQKGEIFGFIGHNGAGKTTTIKSCCGILDFDEGEIFVDGISVKTDPMAAKKRDCLHTGQSGLVRIFIGHQISEFYCLYL